MTVCIKCHRPLKHLSPTGMGPVCASRAKAVAVPDGERDLFGYDLDKAESAAKARLRVQIETSTATALMQVRHDFRGARIRLGVWQA